MVIFVSKVRLYACGREKAMGWQTPLEIYGWPAVEYADVRCLTERVWGQQLQSEIRLLKSIFSHISMLICSN